MARTAGASALAESFKATLESRIALAQERIERERVELTALFHLRTQLERGAVPVELGTSAYQQMSRRPRLRVAGQ